MEAAAQIKASDSSSGSSASMASCQTKFRPEKLSIQDMVMESISPQCVGKEFVRQYYTVLNKAPLHLHRFYSDDSSFVHGGLDQSDEDPVVGQQDIHQKIMQLNFRDCHAKIRQVDAHSTLKNGVVVQVIGELSNNGEPMRQFMQTFVLAPQTPKKYYVRNDIFRYQDQGFIEDEDYESTADTNLAPVLKLQSHHLNVQADKDMDDQISTTVPDPRDNNYYEKDYIRNGPSHLNENEHPTLSSLNVVTNNNINNNNSNAVTLAPSQTLSNLSGGVIDISTSSQPHMEVSSNHSLPPQREGGESPCKSDWEDSVDEEEEEEEEEEPGSASVAVEQQQQQQQQQPAPQLCKTDLHLMEIDDMGAQNLLTPEPKTYANMVSKNTPPSGIPGSHLAGPPSMGTPFTTQTTQQQLQPPQQPQQPQQQQQQQQQAPQQQAPTQQPPPQQQQQISPNSTMMFSGSKQQSDFSKMDQHTPHQHQQSISPNSFSGSGGGYRGLSRPNRYSHRNNTNGRLHNSDSIGGSTGGGGSSYSSNRYNDDSGSEGVAEKRKTTNYYQDSQQLFVGNLPHEIGTDDLKEIFHKFGPVLDVRINNKQNQKMGPSGKTPVPNYGFVVFEDDEAVQKVLQSKPILYGQHRLNVEEKKTKPRDIGDRIMPSGRGSMTRHMGGGGGLSRGGGPRVGMRGSDRGRGGPNFPNRR